MCHIECRSQEVLIRVPYSVAKKFAEVDDEFREHFIRADRKHYDPDKDDKNSVNVGV